MDSASRSADAEGQTEAVPEEVAEQQVTLKKPPLNLLNLLDTLHLTQRPSPNQISAWPGAQRNLNRQSFEALL